MKSFEGCMAIEEMAQRGRDTLLFGPMKPVGLRHPITLEKPYAVVQLRQDDAAKTMYNIVGFQTHLKFSEQKRILQLIPGLENCEIVRYGVMHRNTFIYAPKVLNRFYQAKSQVTYSLLAKLQEWKDILKVLQAEWWQVLIWLTIFKKTFT